LPSGAGQEREHRLGQEKRRPEIDRVLPVKLPDRRVLEEVDRDRSGLVSRASDREDLIEVRANSFAASFLMPEEGVRQFVASLGKGGPSRAYAEVFDEAAVRSLAAAQADAVIEIVVADARAQSAVYRLLTVEQRARLEWLAGLPPPRR